MLTSNFKCRAKYTDNFRAKSRESCVMVSVRAESTPEEVGGWNIPAETLLMLPSAGRCSRTEKCSPWVQRSFFKGIIVKSGHREAERPSLFSKHSKLQWVMICSEHCSASHYCWHCLFTPAWFTLSFQNHFITLEAKCLFWLKLFPKSNFFD